MPAWFAHILNIVFESGLTGLMVLFLLYLIWHFSAWKRDIKDIMLGWPKLKEQVRDIASFIKWKYPDFELISFQSPIGLTSQGQSLAQKSNAESLAAKYAKQIDIPSDANPYDVQTICLEFAESKLLSLLQHDEKDHIKTVAYENGYKVEHILTLIGIILRDRLIREKGMTREAIDLYDPSKKQNAEKDAAI